MTQTKQKQDFRDYENADKKISDFYHKQHKEQTLDFNVKMRELQTPGRAGRKGKVMKMWDALVLLDTLIDESDPDTFNSQLNHGFQSAEAMRRANEPRWFQLVGLIHDAGKMLNFLDDVPGQWCVVGDTFPVGCAPAAEIVYGLDSFAGNLDLTHPIYSTKLGIYEPHCGLDKLVLSYGHDEYLYQTLKDSALPKEALDVIRFHSFYPWHKAGAYTHLTNETDDIKLEWVKRFNQYDLYSKSDKPVSRQDVEQYYRDLIDEFLPHDILW